MRRPALVLLAAVAAAPAHAREPAPVVVSAAPQALAVTIYRDPERNWEAIDPDLPSSLALITETRTVTLPPGEVTVRFEGVASGIIPQSAILFGTDPRERNRDAALLSQGGLVDAFTGQQVTLRRTDPATGKTVEESAVVRSAADRLVVTTPRGVEALYCSGLNQTLIYPHAPATLSAKPVLSMLTKDQPGGTVTITLAYIAGGFDWDATYVAELAPDNKSIGLLGWMTMASGDDTSFPDADAAAVAGRINRSDETEDEDGRRAIEQAQLLAKTAACWPAGTTSDVRTKGLFALPAPAPMMMTMGDIVVTARRSREMLADVPASVNVAVVAKAENLGGLKLYRIPVPVTVAARSQKQVAFLVKPRVEGDLLYHTQISWDGAEKPDLMFRFRNRKQDGLGDPLPAGRAIVFQQGSHGRGYLGEAQAIDKAVDEEVEWTFGQANDVTVENTVVASQDKPRRWIDRVVTVRNANPAPVRFEADFPTDDWHYARISGKLVDKPGKRVWRVTIPAGGIERLTFRIGETEEE